MSLKLTIRIFLIAFCFLSAIEPSFAQTKKKSTLQKEKKQIETEISRLSKNVKEVERTTRAKTVFLQNLKQKQSVRNRLIKSISEQVLEIEKEISAKQDVLEDLTKKLNESKLQYAKMCAYYYSNNQTYTSLMYIFASKNFEQAYKRAKYILEYSDYIKKFGEDIIKRSEDLKNRIIELEKLAEDKKGLLNEQETQVLELKKEQQQEQSILTDLNKKLQKLKRDLNKKISASKKIEAEIQSIIAEEARLRRIAAEKEAKKTGSATKVNNLTPEEKQVNDNFIMNKGKLPWPVEKGVIYTQFGRQLYPGLKDVYIDNQGIEIACPPNQQVRAVFKGKIARVQIVGTHYAIYIQHGNYYTVYNNLAKVFVKQGDNVATKQIIGQIYTDDEEDKTILNFLLFNDNQKQNPEHWLTK